MLGAFSVGKTSLVKRYIQSIFSEKYQTTIGVKIDKKTVTLGGQTIDMILWDLPGEDDFQALKQSYLQGASGYLLVVDGTRKSTLDTGHVISEKVRHLVGDIPYILVINKSDLVQEWDIPETTEKELAEKNIIVFKTSAKTGENVEKAFTCLAEKMISADS
jgi:small GTP-binding protein